MVGRIQCKNGIRMAERRGDFVVEGNSTATFHWEKEKKRVKERL